MPSDSDKYKALVNSAPKVDLSTAEAKEEFAEGMEEEREHTNDHKVRQKLVKDHMKQRPDYYDAMKKLEETSKGLKKQAGVFQVNDSLQVEHNLPAGTIVDLVEGLTNGALQGQRCYRVKVMQDPSKPLLVDYGYAQKQASVEVSQSTGQVSSYDSTNPDEAKTVSQDTAKVKLGKEPAKKVTQTTVTKPLAVDMPKRKTMLFATTD